MELSPLGTSGRRVSRLGFGGWAIGGHGWGEIEDAVSAEAIRRARSLGITLFDTADVYGFGRSEQVLGAALGDDRRDVTIISKFGVIWDEGGVRGRDLSPAHGRRALDASLTRLRLRTIPIYLMHWPDGRTPLRETLRFLCEARKEGKIGAFGCSNFSTEQVAEAVRLGGPEVMEAPFSLLRAPSTLPLMGLARASGLSTIAFDVLAKGLLTGKFDPAAGIPPDHVRSRDPEFHGPRLRRNLRLVEELREVGARYGKTPGQVAIRWVLDHPLVTAAIVGMRTPAQVEENVGALGWRLDTEDFESLSAMAGTPDIA
jgi:myo-inositol catabolism protein IolS